MPGDAAPIHTLFVVPGGANGSRDGPASTQRFTADRAAAGQPLSPPPPVPGAAAAGTRAQAAATGTIADRTGCRADAAEQPGLRGQGPGYRVPRAVDEDVYLASTSTMYRILRAHGEVKEHRR
jgi:hypothetical protein